MQARDRTCWPEATQAEGLLCRGVLGPTFYLRVFSRVGCCLETPVFSGIARRAPLDFEMCLMRDTPCWGSRHSMFVGNACFYNSYATALLVERHKFAATFDLSCCCLQALPMHRSTLGEMARCCEGSAWLTFRDTSAPWAIPSDPSARFPGMLLRQEGKYHSDCCSKG